MKTDPHRAIELAIMLSRYPGAPANGTLIADLTISMQELARAAKMWAVGQCNYPMDEARIIKGDKRIQNIAKKINDNFALCFLGVNKPRVEANGGDPRGPCAFLVLPGTAGESWYDAERYAIY